MPSDRRYLLQRHKAFYVKVRVPPSVQSLFGGKSHIIRSLKTRDISEAQFLRHQVVADIKAQFEAASGNGLKVATQEWQRKLEAKTFDAVEHRRQTAMIKKSKGDLAAAEFVNRSFGIFTDLDHAEAAFFASASLASKTQIQYKYSLKLLREHLIRLGLEQCIEVVDSKVAVSFRKHLIDIGAHRKTAAAQLSANRSRWQYLINEQIIDPPNPWVGVSMPRQKRGTEPPRRPFTDSELVTLFEGDMPQPLFNLCALLKESANEL